ncbi:gluconokinase [Streptacidiphilus sp. P02-A3a]|uniref:gluconokinase n=1 Tax=Streptacidiphilus sp. P02-A3a TaxID=2704468 RepID=UPI0015FBCA66|nr:gluconokinase [Streptacidiphilus sp. P02-A3a]QMU69124.1 gluconokinase [Streptacidiphilus sp. P02-A3a]
MAVTPRPPVPSPFVLVVLGVAGSGKSTVGSALADRLALPFVDADDFHTPADRETMAAGRSLTDRERWPWLGSLAHWMDDQIGHGRSAVVACSALRRSYRDFLRENRPQVRFLYLQGSRELIAARLAARSGHFFPPQLLEDQFAELQEPTADERPYRVPLGGSPDQILARALEVLGDLAVPPREK